MMATAKNQRIYLDNAATTPLDPKVLEAMMPYLQEHFGNPSSIYSYGRESRMAIENARKAVAQQLNCHPSEVFFTSGGTESSNTAINASVRDLGCTHIISSKIEHHATLHTVEHLAKEGKVNLQFVNLLPNGHVNLKHLQELLEQTQGKTLVTLMHANNEIGNLLPIQKVGELCKQYGAIFHADTVQTVGHYPIDLKEINVDFITAAAHKFHGPKGVGLLFVRNGLGIKPFIHGGGQERNMRAGTENIYGIVGLAKALELSMAEYAKESFYIEQLRNYMLTQLQKNFNKLIVNGSADENALYTVLNVGFPKTEKTEMLLMSLDMNHICVSGGSACSSGASVGSHVINAITQQEQVPIRFSFSKYNTEAEVDAVVECLKKLIG
jgi:cysteine desulfurase